MSDKSPQYSPDEINSIFARLDPQDVERFYQSYQLWTVQQQIAGLHTQITSLHQQIAENNEHMQQAHPSAIALATLARLQSHGVTDIDLLDHMLQRGEAWLDQTMQRLAYCEEFDFMRNNYSEWCEHALDGAYDWIDSVQNASSSPEQSTLTATSTTPAASTNGGLEAATEEILLQKLMSEEEAFMAEPTLKRPAISPAQLQETASPLDTSHATDTHPQSSHTSSEQTSTSEQAEDTAVQGEPETEQIPAEPPQLEEPAQPQLTASTGENPEEQTSQVTASEQVEIEPDEQAIEVEQAEHIPAAEDFVPAEVDDAQAASHDTLEPAAPSEQVETELVSAGPVSRSRRKRGFLRRLLTVIFHR